MNKWCAIGRVTKDIDLRKTNTGKSVVTFNLAIKRDKEYTDFIPCVAWNQRADLMSRYVKKGDRIGVEGTIQTRNYQDSNGKRIYITEVIIDRVEFLEPKNRQEQKPEQPTIPEFNSPSDISDDELPF